MALAQQHYNSTQLLNAKEVASMLGISERTVWRLRDAGKLPAPVRLGSSVRWNRASLVQFIHYEGDIGRLNAAKEVSHA